MITQFNYYTKITDASFFDKLDDALGECRTTQRLFDKNIRSLCYIKLEVSRCNTYAKIIASSTGTIRLIPDINHLDEIISNVEFMNRVKDAQSLGILKHE